MSAMFTRTIAKAQALARTARLAAMVKAETTNDLAAATLTSPEGSGRSGWFTRSVSRSYTSLRAFPPAVKAAAAAPAHSNGWANSPHAPERPATRPPIPTPTPDITQCPGREASGIHRHQARRTVRPIPEGLARSPIPDRVDEATRSRHGGDHEGRGDRGGESRRGDHGERGVRAELPGGPRHPGAGDARGPGVPGEVGDRFESDLRGRARDRIPREPERVRGQRDVRPRRRVEFGTDDSHGDEGARPRESGKRRGDREGNRRKGAGPQDPVRRGDEVPDRDRCEVGRPSRRRRPDPRGRDPGEDGSRYARPRTH